MHKNPMIFATALLLLAACEQANILPNSELATAAPNQRIASALYTMPDEADLHEGTWLQWPHQYQYGSTYRNRLDATWVAMAKALCPNEKVHIVAYNAIEKGRIANLLATNGVSMNNIDFQIARTNDVWVRDNGPIYVKDPTNDELTITDWGFNGWGNKAGYANCNTIPAFVAKVQGKNLINLNTSMVLEGGSIEIDGNGTLMATKSAILNKNRNPGMTQSKAEELLSRYLGVKQIIWLEGVSGLEITDMHIDGFMKFANKNTIVTMAASDLLYWQVPQPDIDKLYLSKNINGQPYNFVKLPLTKNDVVTTYGKNLGYKGSYANYYLANNTVLMPNYNDPNDAVANRIIQSLYPTRKVIGIDVRNLYENGGMVHCVTQQQPK